jgi:hypothetical protein
MQVWFLQLYSIAANSFSFEYRYQVPFGKPRELAEKARQQRSTKPKQRPDPATIGTRSQRGRLRHPAPSGINLRQVQTESGQSWHRPGDRLAAKLRGRRSSVCRIESNEQVDEADVKGL